MGRDFEKTLWTPSKALGLLLLSAFDMEVTNHRPSLENEWGVCGGVSVCVGGVSGCVCVWEGVYSLAFCVCVCGIPAPR